MRTYLLALLALTTFACDDGSSPGTTAADMAPTDRGFIPTDAAPTDTGAGGEPADEGVVDAAGGAGGTQPDQGVVPPDVCDRTVGYGLQALPQAGVEGAPRTQPRTVWTGLEWGALWQAPSAELPGISEVLFQRFDASGAPVATPARLGYARLPQLEIVSNGNGYVATWIATRTPDGGVDGIKVQIIDADGAPGRVVDVPSTFDAAHLDLAWAPLAGGMLVYTRGMAGAGGLFVAPVDESGTTQAARSLSPTETRGPTVAFGDGSWGVAWLDRASGNPSDLLFVVVNSQGVPVSQPRRQVDAGAQGAAYLAYGQGTFGVGWSKVDGMGGLAAFVTLYDSAGDVLATPPIPGATGFGLVTDVAWLDPNTFGVAWQDNSAQQITVGLTRVNTQGVVQLPFRLAIEAGHAATGLRLGGNVTRAGIWYVDDPTPAPGGSYSVQARVMNGILGPCP